MEQLRDVLKEVLQEELTPIRVRLDGLDDRMSSMNDRMSSMDDRISSMDGRMSSMDGKISAIQVQLDRMEQAQTEDVVALLRTIDTKITERTDLHEHQINLLNNRLLAVEADVRKLQLNR